VLTHRPEPPFSSAHYLGKGCGKFLSVLRLVRYRNFKFKAATQINKLLELL
jgi:hypothetical protein